nr:MAG TPA: Tryptophanase operon leader peptide [Caudoviricetes sp.]
MLKWWIRFKNEWLDYIILGILGLTLVCWFNMDNIIAATGR